MLIPAGITGNVAFSPKGKYRLSGRSKICFCIDLSLSQGPFHSISPALFQAQKKPEVAVYTSAKYKQRLVVTEVPSNDRSKTESKRDRQEKFCRRRSRSLTAILPPYSQRLDGGAVFSCIKTPAVQSSWQLTFEKRRLILDRAENGEVRSTHRTTESHLLVQNLHSCVLSLAISSHSAFDYWLRAMSTICEKILSSTE